MPPHCCRNGKCKDRFPKPICEATRVGEDGRILYRRRACDVMVVAYNPWLQLVFQGKTKTAWHAKITENSEDPTAGIVAWLTSFGWEVEVIDLRK